MTEAEFEAEIADGTPLARYIQSVILKECARRKWMREEVVEAINLALVEAYMKFDPAKSKFVTLAKRLIDWRIVDLKRRVFQTWAKDVGMEDLEERGLALASQEEPVGWELEWADQVRAAFGTPTALTRRDHALAVNRVLHCGRGCHRRVWKQMRDSARERVLQWGKA